jgi:hypothetical protein
MAFAWVRLYYTFTQSKGQVDYTFVLRTTQPFYGGTRGQFTSCSKIDGRV